MLCKVTHCAGRVSANTRPHQLRWGDREMGTAISCTECSQVAGLIQKSVETRTCILSFYSVFLLLVDRGVNVPGLILAQSQVLAPLNSRPVIGYRQGRATPIWSPVWSGGYVRCVARGLTRGLCKRLSCSLTV